MAGDPYSIFSAGLPTAPAASAPVGEDPYSIFQGGLKALPAAPDTSKISQEDVAKAERVNAFRTRSVDELAHDKHFDPVAVYDSPEVGEDEDLRKKVLDVFKARQSEGFNLGKFAAGAVKGAASLPGAISKGVGTVAGELSNVAEGAIHGNKDRVSSALGELGAGVETNAAGLVSTIERAGDKIFQKKPITDKEWEYQLRKEQNRRNLVKEAASGELGGLDTAVKASGGEINPENVEAASTVLDPTLAIPFLAGSKAARAAEAVVEGGRAAEIAGKAVQAGKNVAASALEKGSVVLDKASQGLKGVVGPTIGGLAELGAGVAGVPAGGIIAGAVAPRVAKSAAESFLQTAGKLRGTVPPGPIWQAVANTARSEVGQGTIKGAAGALGLSGDPLAGAFTALGILGSEDSEQAGQFVGGQAGFGSIAGAGHAGVHALSPFFDIAGQVFKPADPAKPINSPVYGTAPELDTVHAQAIQKLAPEVQNRINQFREAVRDRGSEIYVVDPENFAGAVADMYRQAAEQAGKPLTPEQLDTIRNSSAGDGAAKGLFVDNFDFGNGQKKKVIFLNADGGALQHEGGHLVLSMLEPKERASLEDAVAKRYTPAELADFKQSYEARLGKKISNFDLIDEVLAENVSAILNSVPVEQLGTPKPVARSIYQTIGGLLDRFGIAGDRRTDLGLRPDIGLGKKAENALRAQESEANPQIQETAKVDLTKVDLRPKAAPGNKPPVPPVKTLTTARGEGPDNIRVSRQDQDRFQRAASDESLAKAAKAVDANKAYGPEQKRAFVKVGAAIAQGGDRPLPLEVEYSAARSKEFQAGRDTRRAEQTDTYVKEAMGALPEHVRQLTQKVLIPDRFEVRSGDNVQLLGKSLDKIIANAYILAKDAHKNGVEKLVPYDNKDGALTEKGWESFVDDVQNYTANQSNGYAGDGSNVRQPKDYKGVIPAANPNFKPIAINKNQADFVNMIMALPPPKTGRKGATASGTDANAIARTLAVENGKIPLESITSRDPQKKFFERNNVDIAEFNPLRDEMARAGVKIRDLIEVTERINLEHLKDVKVRSDLNFSRPSTDLIRAGFMPGEGRAALPQETGDVQYTIFREQPHPLDPSKKIPGYVQVEKAMNNGRGEPLTEEERKQFPEPDESIPTGQYTLDQIRDLNGMASGKFMPGDVYIGEVTADGDVKTVRSDRNGTHERHGMGKNTRFRYVPELQKLFWWGHEKPTEVQRESVIASLENKGFKVKSTAVLDVNDINDFDKTFKQAHGDSATAESAPPFDLREILKKLDTAQPAGNVTIRARR